MEVAAAVHFNVNQHSSSMLCCCYFFVNVCNLQTSEGRHVKAQRVGLLRVGLHRVSVFLVVVEASLVLSSLAGLHRATPRVDDIGS